jgi:hypothetical protein
MSSQEVRALSLEAHINSLAPDVGGGAFLDLIDDINNLEDKAESARLLTALSNVIFKWRCHCGRY